MFNSTLEGTGDKRVVKEHENKISSVSRKNEDGNSQLDIFSL